MLIEHTPNSRRYTAAGQFTITSPGTTPPDLAAAPHHHHLRQRPAAAPQGARVEARHLARLEAPRHRRLQQPRDGRGALTMRIITLIPLTKAARRIVRQHGERWEVVRSEQRVFFASDAGPWLLVQPLTEERAPASNARAARVDSAARWVHEHFDLDFKVAP